LISFDQILNELERQLKIARNTSDERKTREALSAIRSLCEVALGDSAGAEKKIYPKMLATSEVRSISSIEGKPLVEEDANGGSLFDF